MLGSEQFTGLQLVENGEAAVRAGFGLLATSNHFLTWDTLLLTSPDRVRVVQESRIKPI
jgi:hypothetical protein